LRAYFTDVKKTLIILSDIGTGHMRPWRDNELGYMSSSRITSSGLWARTDYQSCIYGRRGSISVGITNVDRTCHIKPIKGFYLEISVKLTTSFQNRLTNDFALN